MKKLFIAMLLFALSAIPSLRAQENTAVQMKVEEAVRNAIADYATAWNAHDAHGLAQLYTVYADYTGFEALMTRGRAGIENRYAELLAGPLAGSSTALDISGIRMIASDVALVDGRVQITDPNGHQTVPGSYMAVMTQEDGQWRITSFWSKPGAPVSGTPSQ